MILTTLPRRLFGALAAVAATCALTAAAAAQPLPPPTPEEFAARGIARTAIFDLRFRNPPGPEDARIAYRLLELAESLTPKDTELTRKRIEAAFLAQDPALLDAATARLVTLDPADTVAQLRLLTSRIARQQTAEARLATYARVLGRQGEGIDASVRSRLALDAALLARETGDEARFVEYLKQATSLDSTNKEAALVAYGFYSSRVSDPLGNLELLSNLLLADPFDPNVHRQLAQALAYGGAFTPALRFHANAAYLYLIGQAQQDPSLEVEKWALIWQTQGAATVVAQLNETIRAERFRVERAERAAEKDILAGGRPSMADQVRLTPLMERFRFLAAISAKDRASVETSVRDMALANEVLLMAVKDPSLRPKEFTEQQFVEAARAAIVEAQFYRLWGEVDVDKIEEDLARLAPIGLNEESALLRALRAWQLLHAAKPQEAIEAFDALSAEFSGKQIERALVDMEFVRFGRAYALRALGNFQDAATILLEAAARRALDMIGAFALDGAAQMGAYDENRVATANRMIAYAETIPAWVDRAVREPGSIMRLTVEPRRTTYTALDRGMLRVRIRNDARVPLSLGSDRTISSRMLVSSKFTIDTQELFEDADPEIVELDRRLRIMPNETFEADFWAGPGWTGWLAESNAGRAIRVIYRLVQGFMPSPGGAGMGPGPNCLTAETAAIGIMPIPEARLPTLTLADELRSCDNERLVALAAAARAQFMDRVWSPNAPSPQELDALARAAADRYRSADAVGKLLLLGTLPNAANVSELAVFDDATLAETEPGPLLLVLTTRAKERSSPPFERARSLGGVAGEVAAIQAARLADGSARLYATHRIERRSLRVEIRRVGDPTGASGGK